MKMNTLPWQPKEILEHFFIPTRFDRSAELAKARFKNHNLPILQYMYHGDRTKPLTCVMSGQPGFINDYPCLVTKRDKQRFNIDFNHIRQIQNGENRAGDSIDKSNYDPSAIFRSKYLDDPINRPLLVEFMTIMPVSQEIHAYITQDSALGHITLQSFDQKYWPWVLQNQSNFDKFCKQHNLGFLDYDWFIDHLSHVHYPKIADRIAMFDNFGYNTISFV